MTEQLAHIRIVYASVKDAYDDFFAATRKYERACSLLNKLKKLMKSYERCIKKRIILTCFLVVSLILVAISFVMKKKNTALTINVFILDAVFIPVSVILLIWIFSLTYKKLKVFPYKYERLVNEMILGDKNEEASELNRISAGRKLCTVYEALIETSLLPIMNEAKRILTDELLKLEPYVSEEYRTYECVCSCISIIDSNRADTLKETVNLMVEDMRNKKLVEAINDAKDSIASSLYHALSSGFGKVTDAVKQSTSDIINDRNKRNRLY